jgi:uncharacterized low-complexity protein
MKKFAALALALTLAVPAVAFAQTPQVQPATKPAATAPSVAQAPKAADTKKTETGTHTNAPTTGKEQPKKN